MSRAYYNEIDPYAAQWLRHLIAEGLIADGDVDERSIWNVHPSDLDGYTQCHFFAGLGGWSYALRLAGWPDHRPVWTGSCPCQPFSQAGKGLAFADERHLWPAFHWLISECRPHVIFGEQVDAAVGRSWLDLVSTDLEEAGYRVGPVVLPAAGVGAPHIRHRLWFVADAMPTGRAKRRAESGGGSTSRNGRYDGMADAKSCGRKGITLRTERGLQAHGVEENSQSCRMVQSDRDGCAPGRIAAETAGHRDTAQSASDVCGMANDYDMRSQGWSIGRDRAGERSVRKSGMEYKEQPGANYSYWRAADWLLCRDAKWRPVEPGTQPLAHGISARVGKLRAYGNAIVPQVAAAFIASFLDLASADQPEPESEAA